MSKIAHIVVYRVDDKTPAIFPHGVNRGIPDLASLDGNIWLGPRPVLEAEVPADGAYPAFLQIIPYIVIRHAGNVLHYVRPQAGNEARLHGKVAIGVGGHIDMTDVRLHPAGNVSLADTLAAATIREIEEEIGLSLASEQIQWAATMYLQDTPVDRVHLALVGIVDISSHQLENLRAAEDELSDHRFATPGDIAAIAPAGSDAADWQLETWTRVIVEEGLLA